MEQISAAREHVFQPRVRTAGLQVRPVNRLVQPVNMYSSPLTLTDLSGIKDQAAMDIYNLSSIKDQEIRLLWIFMPNQVFMLKYYSMNNNEDNNEGCLPTFNSLWIKLYDADLSVRSRTGLLKDIRRRLRGTAREEIFRNTCFGHWLDIPFTDNEPHLVHLILQTQIPVDTNTHSENDPLTYRIGNFSVQFGHVEFCLVTGLLFGPIDWSLYESGDIPFRRRVFGHISSQFVYLSNVIDLFDSHMFDQLMDIDAVRVCLLMCLELVFNGREPRSAIDNVLFRLVDHVEAWNTFPWGSYVWASTYSKLVNAYETRREKQLKSLSEGKLPKYTLFGFIWAFKIWILETFPVSSKWWMRDDKVVPRAIGWHRLKPFLKENHEDFLGLTLDQYPPIYPLRPRHDESISPWWIASTRFFDGLVDYVPPPARRGRITSQGYTQTGLPPDNKVRQDADNTMHREETNKTTTSHDTLEERFMALEMKFLTLERSYGELRSEYTLEFMSLKKRVCNLEHKYHAFNEENEENGGHIPDWNLNEISEFSCEQIIPTHESMVSPGSVSKLSDRVERVACKEQTHILSALHDDPVMEFHRHEDQEETKYYINKEAITKLLSEEKPKRDRKASWMLKTPWTKQPSTSPLRNPRKRRAPKPRSPVVFRLPAPLPHVYDWCENLSRVDPTTLTPLMGANFWNFYEQCDSKEWRVSFCRAVKIYKHFWEELLCMDKEEKGWIGDDHLSVWIDYLNETRPTGADWCIVDSWFIELLLRDGPCKVHGDGSRFKVAWRDVRRVFFPINNMNRHWTLAEFDITSGVITVYDSLHRGKSKDMKTWVADMHIEVEVLLPYYLENLGVLEKHNISRSDYSIKFQTFPFEQTPQQASRFGDCGIFVCIFLYRLTHGLPLNIVDTVQAALAYREHMAEFFLQYLEEWD